MAREITYNNFEISNVVFTPNITTNHAITYTNFSIQSNPVNTDSEGNTESDFINRVSVFSRSWIF